MAPGALNQQQPTKFFSGNGVSVAAMCAESDQYRPLLATTGGIVRTPINPTKPILWETYGRLGRIERS